MMDRDRATLAGMGLLALAALGAAAWSRSRPAAVLAPAQAARWDAALRASRGVDVNTAGVAELERLPEIGPALAVRIVEERAAHGPFLTRQDLTRVPGIGEKTMEAVERYITTVTE